MFFSHLFLSAHSNYDFFFKYCFLLIFMSGATVTDRNELTDYDDDEDEEEQKEVLKYIRYIRSNTEHISNKKCRCTNCRNKKYRNIENSKTNYRLSIKICLSFFNYVALFSIYICPYFIFYLFLSLSLIFCRAQQRKTARDLKNEQKRKNKKLKPYFDFLGT